MVRSGPRTGPEKLRDPTGALAMARNQDEVTWEQVADALGISIQSAHHRFANKA